jgi:hypothetical protein
MTLFGSVMVAPVDVVGGPVFTGRIEHIFEHRVGPMMCKVLL